MVKVIEVEKLVKRYKKAKYNAVDGISFYVKEGEFYAFLGPNGAGKTTTLSILTTTLNKTSGEVCIAGFDTEREAANVRKNIGVIFQKPSLDLNLTAEENIRFHAVLYGLYPFSLSFSGMPKTYQKRVSDLSGVLGIKKDIQKPVKTFSGGMKRKLEIIRSLMHNPKILFLDEPTSGLDPESRRGLWEYLNEVRKSQKTTIFLTTHYLEEAEEVDHLSVINHGKIVAHGSPAEIKNKLVKEYIILDAKQKSKLVAEIEKMKINFELENGHLKIPIQKLKPQKIISSIKTPLSLLRVHSPTLEQAYLEIIQQNEK